jgi:putative FmdB family regulatory protein
MPFYEYECPSCGYRDEVLQKITDKPLKKCPTCGKSGLKKLMSAPVFRLKGSGWYETDFKSDQEKKRNLAGPDKEESKSDDKKDTKADAKADTKVDAKPDTPKGDKAETAKPAPVKPAAQKAKSSAASRRAAKRRPPARKARR